MNRDAIANQRESMQSDCNGCSKDVGAQRSDKLALDLMK